MFMHVYACLWMFICLYVYMFMDVYGCLWMFMDVYGKYFYISMFFPTPNISLTTSLDLAQC